MALPTDLNQALKDALHSIDQNAQRRLHLPYRQRIWRAMGPNQRDTNDRPFGVGLKRRTRLAILCVEKVLPIWFNAYPEDDDPALVIATAERLLEKKIDHQSASNIMDSFDVKIMNLDQEVNGHPDGRPAMVGSAVSSALSTALVDCDDFTEIDDDLTDFDDDPETWECSVFASMAYANEQPALGLFEADKMGYFWQWYIKEAVPKAYRSYRD
jgi:hypothetical protein